VKPLTGKAALVTGGSTETAQAIALALSGQGAAISITGGQVEMLERVASAIQGQGGRCLAFPADTTLPDDVDRLVAAALEFLGGLDILVSVSSVWGGGPIHAHKIKTWDLALAANLRSNFLLARAVLPLFRLHRNGHLVVIASESAMQVFEGDGAYGVSMHALLHLCEYIRLENRGYGIRVSALCPGLVLTPGVEPDQPSSLLPEDISAWVIHLVTARESLHLSNPLLFQS
jgi:NAD(P)-dependent dehydrogenase (short-subunit alcohol dehydrogenase family)